MNKIYKVIWSKARNCYVAVSEIANAHSKGGKRARAALLSAVLSIGLAASGSVFASEPASTSTVPGQYVAGKFSGISSNKSPCKYDFPSEANNGDRTTVTLTSGSSTETITYVYDASTEYWVREGYKLVARQYQTTDLATDTSLYDIVWTDATKQEPTSALSTVTSLQKANGTMTNMGEALEALTPTKIEGVTNSAGTGVYGSYNYIIVDSSWKDEASNYSNGYTDLKGITKPLGFITAEDVNSLSWDENHQCYVFTNADGTQDLVNYHNTYVLDIYNSKTEQYESKIGVFTKADGSLYTGNVYGKHNEILTTTKGDDGSFYSYWGSMVTDQALTMSTYYVTQYKNDLDTLVENDNKLYRNDIRSVDMKNNGESEATLSLYRNGSDSAGSLVDGQLTITRIAQDYDADTGTAGEDTKIQITGTYQDGTNRTDQTLTLDTGSRVSVTAQKGTDNVAETITVNGQSYKVSMANAAKVTAGTNVTVDEDTDTTTGAKTYTVSAKDTTYTAGDHVSIDATANNKISVKVDGAVAKGDTNIVNGDTVYNAIINTVSNNDIKSGSIGNDGKVTLTKNDDSAIEVGTVKDYSVTTGTYDSINKKITLTKQNAYNATETATVDIDLTALEQKMGDLTNITNTGEKKITNIAANAVVVAKGTNIDSIGEDTNTETGVKTYTINAKDTTLKQATSSTDATTGAVTWTITDTDGKSVTLDDLASNTALSRLDEGAVKYDRNEDKTVNHNSVTMGGKAYNDTDKTGGTTITNVSYATVTDKTATGYDGSQAVNMDRLNDSIADAIKDSTDAATSKGFALIGSTEGSTKVQKNLGEAITVAGENGINVSSDGEKVLVSLGKDITIGTKGEDGEGGKKGEAGSIGLAGEDGTNGKDGNVIEITVKNGENKDGTDGKDDEKGAAGVDGEDGEDGITRIVYQDKQGEHQVATMEDGLKFKGDDDTVIAKKLNNTMEIIGGVNTTTTKLTDGNIGVVSTDNGALKVKLAEALSGITSITNGDVSITLNSGDTKNITIKGGDLNVNNNKITNVKNGENDGDAVNMGQLKEVEKKISTLGDGAVMYDTKDDKVDYTKVTMGGKEGIVYSRKEVTDEKGNVTVTYAGGTTITNVSYAEVSKRGADGYDGSQAVNMDRLNDSIADAMSQVKTDVAGTEKHIKAGTYEIENGKVTMQLVDGNENDISGGAGKVIINDVAKASDIGSLNGGHTTDGDGKLKDDLRNTKKNEDGTDKTDESGNIIYKDTTVVDAINKVDDKVEAVKTDVTNLEKNFNDYKSTTDTKIDNINTSIKNLTEDVNRRSTTVTVNEQQDGNLKLLITEDLDNKKVNFDISLSDIVTLGEGDKAVTLDGTTGGASISKKLTVGGKDGVTIEKQDLGTYSKDITNDKGETLHKKGDTMSGYSAGGLANTTIHYDKFADGSGKAATEEQLKEALGDMDFDATIKNQAGETVNKYNIVNTATNVTEAVYQLDQNLTQANARIDNNTINIQKLSGSLGKLNTRVNRVGAGAAALAALHPLDFDPDDKWDFAAGYGNYAGANATAIGAYYRPNEDTMLSIAGSFGGGENMVNAGVSFKLGRGNHVTTSKVAMAKEIKSLRATVEEQGKQIAALTALVEKLTGETLAAPEAPAPAKTFTVDTVEEKDGQPVIERVRTAKGA